MSTTLPLLIGLGIVTVGLVLALIIVLLSRTGRGAAASEGLALVQQQLDALRRQTQDALAGSSANMNQQMSSLAAQLDQRLDEANRTVRSVSTQLGELSQASQRMLEVGRDIASLQDILRTPKLRGIIGELFLGDLLKQLVPNNYEMQYRFRSGEAVDAVVRLGPRLVPIDAKFPLEDFQRLVAEGGPEQRRALRRRFVAAVRKHVDAVARKYILPDEGTFDFALMYIPAENVYYETITKDEPGEDGVTAYAMDRKVIPVSPNSLYAYLQAIVLGLRGFQIERRAEEIQRHLGRLQQDFAKFRGDFDVVGTHLKNARSKYEDAVKHLDRLEDKLAVSVGPERAEDDALPGRQQ